VKLEKLDAIRGFAAFYVAMGHLLVTGGKMRIWWLLFGQEAIILFFLLSGFVIKMAADTEEDVSFRCYFFKRFRRIYPILLAAYLISITVQLLNKAPLNFSGTELLGNLFMLQDLGNGDPEDWVDPFLGNIPLWSLSYEWYFYMMFFPLNRLLREGVLRVYVMLAISLFGWLSYILHINLASLILAHWMIWWAGAESASIFLKHRTFNWLNMKHVVISLAIMTLATAIPLLFIPWRGVGLVPFVVFRHFASALGFVALGLLWWKHKLVGFQLFPGPFARIAAISYAIYAIHYPIFVLLKIPGDNVFAMVVRVIVVLVLSYLLERRLQPIVNRCLRC
jgi:peptidoglycan/LPS O-acetylase OafA/YrhL